MKPNIFIQVLSICKSKIGSFISLFIFVSIIINCSKENIPYTVVQTGNVYRPDSLNIIFTAKILNKEEQILEYGFEWDLINLNKNEHPRSYNASEKGEPSSNYFELKISTSVEKGRDYRVRAFLKTSRGNSYGRYVEFTAFDSETPQVFKIIPDTVTWKDTLTIIGKNFGYSINDIKITAGKFNLPVIRLSMDTIFATIPTGYDLHNTLLTINVLKETLNPTDIIYLAPPQIMFFDPDTAGFYSLVKIVGRYLYPSIYSTNLYIDNVKTDFVNITWDTIIFRVPAGLNVGTSIIELTVFGQSITYLDMFYISGPLIYNFSPQSGTSGTEVTINGKFFVNGYTKVLLGGNNVTVKNINDTTIKFLVPDNIAGGPLELKVTIDNKSVTANQMFDRIAPSITGFFPDTAAYGDTITISGDRFSTAIQDVKLRFGSFPAEVVSSSENEIKAVVPALTGITSCKLYITIGTETSISSGSFYLAKPVITNFYPKTATFNDTITIKVDNIHPDVNKIAVTLGGVSQVPFMVDRTTLKTTVSSSYTGTNGLSNLILRSDIMTCTSSDQFQIISPIITSISPTYGEYSDTITMYGEYLNPSASKSVLKIPVGNTELVSVYIIFSSPDSLKFIIPYASDGLHDIMYQTGGRTTTMDNILTVHNPFVGWTLHESWQGRFDAYGFAIGNDLYQGCGRNDRVLYYGDLTRVTLGTFQWYRYTGVGGGRLGATGFSIGTKGYCLYENRLYEFDPALSLWTEKKPFPGNGIKEQSAFVINDKVYVIGGLDINSQPLDEFWEYDSSADLWTQKAIYPGGPVAEGIGFAISGKGYAGLGTPNQQYLWEYDPDTDMWSEKCKIPDLVTNIAYDRISAICFTINGKAYLGTGFSKKSSDDYFRDLYEYNPVSNTWKLAGKLPLSNGFAGALGYSVGSLGFIMGGQRGGMDLPVLWEFNPALSK